MNSKKTTFYLTVASLTLPAGLACIIYAVINISPFGLQTLFTNDMSYEYVGILSYFGHLLRGNGDFFYTFSKVLGGDMAGLFGYYLLSPFNLLAVFFRPEQMPAFILLLTLLKIGFSGMTMNLYLRHQYSSWTSLLFSTAYALMSYNIAYQQNIMWLDGVIILPLMIWGLDNIRDNKNILLYTLSLAYGLITNFYIGYMLCIFSVLYFGIHFLLRLKVGSWRENRTILFRYISGSLLAGGLAAVFLLPAAISLQGGKSEIYLGRLLNFEFFYKPLDVLKNLLPGQFDINGGTFNSPNIYCGIFVLVFTFLFFISRKVDMKKKIGSLFLILFLFTSLLLKNFERAWHGLELPTGYPHRNSFLLSFILIVTAYAGWRASMEASVLVKKTVLKNTLCAFICVVSVLELSANGILLLKTFSYHGKADYQKSVYKDYEAVSKLKERDKSFYRMEDTHGGFGMDTPMLLNYRGLASSYSGEKLTTKTAAGNLGLNEKTTWIGYHDQMSVGMESLLSLKYLVTKDKLSREAYELIDKQEDMYLYENPYMLPLGVLADAAVLNAQIDNRDMFAIQNEVWNSILRDGEPLYTPIKAKELYRRDDGVTYEFIVNTQQDIYTNFMDESLVDICRIFVNGQEQTSFKPEKMPYRLGRFQEGDVIRAEIRSESNDIDWYDLYFYYENMPVLERNIGRIREEAYRITDFNEHYFQGTIANFSGEERYAFFTIPYDRGWTVKIDGKRMEPDRTLNSLMCIKVPEGEHELTLRFLPQGLLPGGIISALSVMALVIISRRRQH